MATLARFLGGAEHVTVFGDIESVLAADIQGQHYLDITVDGDVTVSGSAIDGFFQSDGLLTVENNNVVIDNGKLSGAMSMELSGNNHRLDFQIDNTGTTGSIIGDALFGSRLKIHISRSPSHTVDYFIDFDGCDDNTIEVECASNSITGGAWSAKHLIRLLDSDRNKVAIKSTYVNFTTNNVHDFVTISGTSTANSIFGCKLKRISGSGNRPRHAVNITDSTCVRNRIVGNDFGAKAAYAGAVINDGGTDTMLFWPGDAEVGDNFVDEIAGSGPGPSGGGIGITQITPVSTNIGPLSAPFTGTHQLVWPWDVELVSIRPTVGDPPTGAAVIIDVLIEGTTAFPTTANPQVAAGTDVGALAVPDTVAVPAGDAVTFNIDQVGSTNPGEDLTVIVEWMRVS